MATVRQRPAQSSRSSDETIVEKGDIFFAYRPRTGEDKAKGLADVQRFFMVLKPESQNLVRLAVLGRKRLPQAEGHERIWGFVERWRNRGPRSRRNSGNITTRQRHAASAPFRRCARPVRAFTRCSSAVQTCV